MLVYQLLNLKNGKLYIGITKHSTPEKRFRVHVWQSQETRSWNGNSAIQSAIRKYGKDCWSISVLARASSWDELCALERSFIHEKKSNDRNFGYNLTLGGEGRFGAKHSPEEIAKRSLKLKGRTFSPETRLKLSLASKGKKKSASHVANSVTARIGYKKTPDQIEKSAKFHRGKIVSAETRAKLSAALKGKTNGKKRKPFCGRGHPLNGENLYTYIIASGKQRACCKICMQENNKRQSERRYGKGKRDVISDRGCRNQRNAEFQASGG